jgi:signal transduction histidine kinase
MLKFCLLLWVLCWAWPAQALLLGPEMGVHAPVNLAGQLSVLRDAGGQLRIEEVAAPDRADEFVPLPGILSAGFTPDAYWLRLTLQRAPTTPEQWLLEVGPSYLNDVSLYEPQAEGGFKVTRLGDLQAFAERPVQHRNFVFPLSLPAAKAHTLYLRVKTQSSLRVQVDVWQFTGLLAQAQAQTGLFSVYLGILSLAFVVNLMFLFTIRERIYVSYCAYLAAMILVTLAVGGFVSQWFFPHWPLVGNRMVGFSVCMAYVTGGYFFTQVLGLRLHFKRASALIDGVLWFYALCAVAAIVGFYGVVAPTMMVVAVATNFCATLAALWLLWRGHREYLFYILAFAVNFAAVPFSVAMIMGWLVLPVSTDFITVLGSIIHIVLLSFTMVNRLRRTEEKMRVVVLEAAALAAERDAVLQQRQFVAMVSHEFRTPLAVIDATAQSVELACLQSGSAPIDFLAPRQEKIRRAVRRMVSLLDNFLTHERLDFHAVSGQREVLDLRDLALEAALHWAHLLHQPEQLQLVLGEVAVPVRVERALVALALSNLIDNAIKYSPPGRPITLRVGRSKSDGWMEVQDQGVGIDTAEQSSIFDKFYRSGTAQAVPGAGLGLYLVRAIARSQGGAVEVESQSGQGARFNLKLPLALLDQSKSD